MFSWPHALSPAQASRQGGGSQPSYRLTCSDKRLFPEHHHPKYPPWSALHARVIQLTVYGPTLQACAFL